MPRKHPSLQDSDDSTGIAIDTWEQPLSIPATTIHRIFSEDDAGDLIALYSFYYQTALYYQRSKPIWATTSFAAVGCGKSEQWVRRVKKRLIALGFVEEQRARQVIQEEGRERVVWGKLYLWIKFFKPNDSSTLEDLLPLKSSTLSRTGTVNTIDKKTKYIIQEVRNNIVKNPRALCFSDSSLEEEISVIIPELIRLSRGRKLSKTQQQHKKLKGLTPTLIQIGSWFGRKSTTACSVYEALSLVDCEPSTSELHLMEQFYTANIPADKDYRRRNLHTLLNNWISELDKAREWRNKRRGSGEQGSFR